MNQNEPKSKDFLGFFGSEKSINFFNKIFFCFLYKFNIFLLIFSYYKVFLLLLIFYGFINKNYFYAILESVSKM